MILLKCIRGLFMFMFCISWAALSDCGFASYYGYDIGLYSHLNITSGLIALILILMSLSFVCWYCYGLIIGDEHRARASLSSEDSHNIAVAEEQEDDASASFT